MTWYRLVIEEINDSHVTTNFTRWLDAVELRGTQDQEIYVSFGPRFEHVWLEAKKRLLVYADQKPANIGLRSQYAIRLYSWAKKYATVGAKRISLEQLRKLLRLESVKDAGLKHCTRIGGTITSSAVTTLTFAIKAQAIPDAAFKKEKRRLKPSTIDSTNKLIRGHSRNGILC